MAVDANESSCSVVHIIIPLAKVKVHDIHRVHFFNLGIWLPFGDVLHDHLGRPIQHPMEVVGFAGILDFDDDQLALVIFHEDIHPVELVVLGFLISFAFKDLFDLEIFMEQLRSWPCCGEAVSWPNRNGLIFLPFKTICNKSIEII